MYCHYFRVSRLFYFVLNCLVAVHLENIAHVINVLFHPIINATMKVIVQAIPSVVGEVASYAQVKDLYQV